MGAGAQARLAALPPGRHPLREHVRPAASRRMGDAGLRDHRAGRAPRRDRLDRRGANRRHAHPDQRTARTAGAAEPRHLRRQRARARPARAGCRRRRRARRGDAPAHALHRQPAAGRLLPGIRPGDDRPAAVPDPRHGAAAAAHRGVGDVLRLQEPPAPAGSPRRLDRPLLRDADERPRPAAAQRARRTVGRGDGRELRRLLAE